jgi:hypothetical protein
MGYCYSQAGRLCCDACGNDSGVRKRTCPYKVHYSDGTGSLPYCSPSALCATCYTKYKDTLHTGHKEGAAKRTAEEAARGAKLQAGDLEVKSAWGSWCPTVPTGFTGVFFANPFTKDETYRLLPSADYKGGGFLSDYNDPPIWAGPMEGK